MSKPDWEAIETAIRSMVIKIRNYEAPPSIC